MTDFYTTIQESPTLQDYEKYYWGYQYRLSRDVMVPELQQRGAFKSGDAVAEIGCGEAGVLDAFIAAGATNPLGTDISTYRLGVGKKIADSLGLQLTLTEHDIIGNQPQQEWYP